MRLPTLSCVLADIATRKRTLTVRGWYGEMERVVELVSATVVWYHSAMSPLPIRLVQVHDR